MGHVTVGKILKAMGYSKQVNQKMQQIGESHPDRNAQFEYINKTAAVFLDTSEPVISLVIGPEAITKVLVTHMHGNHMSAFDARGHTPSHTAFLLESGNDRLLLRSDLIHAALLQFPHSELNQR